MEKAILASDTEMVTVAMKRIELENKEDDMLKHILHPHIQAAAKHQRRTQLPRKQSLQPRWPAKPSEQTG